MAHSQIQQFTLLFLHSCEEDDVSARKNFRKISNPSRAHGLRYDQVSIEKGGIHE